MIGKLLPNHLLRRGDLIAGHEFERVFRIGVERRRQLPGIISFQRDFRVAIGFGIKRFISESFNHREFVLLLAKQNVALAEV